MCCKMFWKLLHYATLEAIYIAVAIYISTLMLLNDTYILYIPKAMLYLCNSGFRDFTPCLQWLWKWKDLCTCWRISPVSYCSCMMAEVSRRYCCYCIFESVWAAILDSFPPENLCLVRNAASHLSLSLRECRCCRKWGPFVCMQWQTPNVKHHDPFGYLNERVSVGCCLATKWFNLNNTKWNRWKW